MDNLITRNTFAKRVAALFLAAALAVAVIAVGSIVSNESGSAVDDVSGTGPFAMISGTSSQRIDLGIQNPFRAEPAYAATKNGLVKESGFYRYYKNGRVLTSQWKTIGGYRYYFTANGNAVAGRSAKISGKYWVFGNTGHLLKPSKSSFYTLREGRYYVGTKGHPAKVGWFIRNDKLYYAKSSGKLLTSTVKDGVTFTAKGYATSNTASKLKMKIMRKVASLTDSSMTKKQKLHACFDYVMERPYDNSYEPTDIGKAGWMQRCAWKTFKTGKDECFGRACTFAAFAYQLGYEPVIKRLKNPNHAVVVINGYVYDNAYWHFGKKKESVLPKVIGEWEFDSWGTAKTKTTSTKAATSKTGLVTIDGAKYYVKSDGTYLQGSWKTIGDYRYYFKKSGKAAVGPLTLTSGRYVFLENGRLAVGTEVHTVTVNGMAYRVTAAGKAKPGFNDDNTCYYLTNGQQCYGIRVAGEKLYACSDEGVYDPELTAQVRALAGVNYCSEFEQAMEATELLELLGEPSTRVEGDGSCHNFVNVFGVGTDVKYTYPNGLVVQTFMAPDGIEYVENYS